MAEGTKYRVHYAQRASPGIFKDSRGLGGNIKVLKSAFCFWYSRLFGYYKSVEQGEITQNLMFCKYLVADRRSLFTFRIAQSGFNFCLL